METAEQTAEKVKGLIESIDGLSIRSVKGKATVRIIVDCKIDRKDAKIMVDDKLSREGYNVNTQIVSGSSFNATIVVGKRVEIIYKNMRGGGMSETTLNSSITELFPAIAFLKKVAPEVDTKVFWNNIVKANSDNLTCYLGQDYKAGKEFVDGADKSSKFDSKIKGAYGVLKFLEFQNKGKPIKNVMWGYRAKPNGVISNHPGDLFVEYNDGKRLGVSIKSGGANTQEPKLNTYVKPIMDWFGASATYIKWQEEAYNLFYADIPNIPKYSTTTFAGRTFYDALGKFESSNITEYDKKYNALLVWLRDKVIKFFNENQEKSKDWLLERVTGEQKDVPLAVVKAVETSGTYELLTDDDIVKACVVRSRHPGGLTAARGSAGSKQNFTISLTCNAKSTPLEFAIRTNGVGVQHKLGQGINLAVKFNGVAKK
jgi:hypothetical protein